MLIVPYVVPIPPATWFLWGGALITFVTSHAASSLRTEDHGVELEVRFPYLPLLGTRIKYAKIVRFKADKSSILGGWGMRYFKGGWLYNVWGFDCVAIQTEDRLLRIGTDDLDGLLNLLEERCKNANV